MEGDKKQQEKTLAELIELRNTVCLFFLLVNALFVTIVFSLQQVNADSGGNISIQLPCAEGGRGESIEPISIAFTAVFGVLLAIQFLCMCIHRMSTFLQILSITEIGLCTPKRAKTSEDSAITVEKGLELVKSMQAVKDDDTKSVVSSAGSVAESTADTADTDEAGGAQNGVRRKELWSKLARRRREQQYSTLSNTFMKNFKKLQRHMEDSDMSSSANLDAGNSAVTPGITVTSPEDGTVQSRELKSARMVFRRMDRKSIFTIVQMSKDPRIKSAIVQRGEVVANRWRKAALRAKIQSSTVPSSGSAQDRPKSKVTVNDIARLAVAERDSNIPSDTESDNDVHVEKFAF